MEQHRSAGSETFEYLIVCFSLCFRKGDGISRGVSGFESQPFLSGLETTLCGIFRLMSGKYFLVDLLNVQQTCGLYLGPILCLPGLQCLFLKPCLKFFQLGYNGIQGLLTPLTDPLLCLSLGLLQIYLSIWICRLVHLTHRAHIIVSHPSPQLDFTLQHHSHLSLHTKDIPDLFRCDIRFYPNPRDNPAIFLPGEHHLDPFTHAHAFVSPITRLPLQLQRQNDRYEGFPFHRLRRYEI